MEQKVTIMEFKKNKQISGKVIDLIPLKKDNLPDVVRMRNQAKSRYFLNQGTNLTIEMQEKWFEGYLNRDNDIYWGIFTKDGKMIGTQRLYDIAEESCEQGSTVIDEQSAMGGPYAAEAILLSLKFAFDKLGVKKVVNDNRYDNKNMNSISRKIGFKLIREQDIRGVKYLYYELTPDTFNEKKLQTVINNWMNR